MTIYKNVGFEIRKDLLDLRHKFLSAGYEGWISFVQAAIRSGVTSTEAITAEALGIAGSHIEAEFRFLIEEGENENWRINDAGELSLMGGAL